MRNIDIYQIDTGVPVPEGRFTHIPLSDLAVGESILFPLAKRPSVQSAVSKLKRASDKDFTIKKMDAESARVWRTK